MTALAQGALTPTQGALRAVAARQGTDGALHGDYSGPLFLLPMYVGASHVVGAMPNASIQAEMVRYLRGVQNPDGGFGLGEENPSTVFTSVLNYVTLRLLGVPASDPDTARCRAWFISQGGAAASAQWGRFFLAVLNLHPWSALDPTPPELWLLPRAAPIHPGRMWCHARMVYLPMAWLYGTRSQARLDDTLRALRDELYPRPWDELRPSDFTRPVAATDAYTPHTLPMRVANLALRAHERVASKRLRQRALDEALHQIRYEDEITDYICIGPVNKAYNTLVWHFADPGGEALRRHLARLPDYLQVDARGVRMNGYNNSKLWDTAFAAQAVLAAADQLGDDAKPVLEGLWTYIRNNQIPEDPPDRRRHYRCRSKGGWPFSDIDHGWPITDCTSEGLKVSLLLREHVRDPLPESDLAESVERILEWQNPCGGWASYERTRGPRWLEWFNPSDVFGDIMVDYPYPECTSACLQALADWQRRPGATADPRVDAAIASGRDFLLREQRADGGWFGSWGVCFTYGTWFGIWGLRAAGLEEVHPAIQRAADFLERLQLADGGWGEHIDACRERRPIPTAEGQAVMTSWALLGLAKAGRRDSDAFRRGVAFLLARQNPDGSFPTEHIAGVFNKTCSIHYDSYRSVFPLWALALARP